MRLTELLLSKRRGNLDGIKEELQIGPCGFLSICEDISGIRTKFSKRKNNIICNPLYKLAWNLVLALLSKNNKSKLLLFIQLHHDVPVSRFSRMKPFFL